MVVGVTMTAATAGMAVVTASVGDAIAPIALVDEESFSDEATAATTVVVATSARLSDDKTGTSTDAVDAV